MYYAQKFTELEVYQLCRQLSKEIFEISKTFPKEEMYSLTDQIRRSSRSIGGQIAEAWAKRKYEKHFVSKLTDADGEQEETVHWLWTALDCSYITEEVGQNLIDKYGSVHRMLKSMIDKSSSFALEASKKASLKMAARQKPFEPFYLSTFQTSLMHWQEFLTLP